MGAAGTLVGVRSDLRLADNPALTAALARGGPVVPVFVWAPEEEAPWPPGGASRWWLHQSLRSHDQNLRRIGSGLIIRRGETLKALRALAKETGANGVVWNRRYEPVLAARDARVKYALREAGLHVEEFNAALLREPWTIKNKSGRPFQVFTAFWRHCLGLPAPEKPLPAPKRLPALAWQPRSAALDALELEPRIDWAKGLRLAWTPGEAGAGEMLQTFLPDLDDYDERRDFPGSGGTSRLSPHLHFGEISPRQIWDGVARRAAKRGHAATQARTSRFLAELGWREFAHHLLHHFPHTPRSRCVPSLSVFHGARTPPPSAPGKKDAPASQWWMRACVSCGRLAGCTIACE